MTRETLRADFLVLGSGHRRPAGRAGIWPATAGAGRHQGPAHGEQHRLRAGRGGGGGGRRRRARSCTSRTPWRPEAGIVSGAAARVLVEEGPERIRELASWGARFDREAGRLHFTREGAHSRNRVLHALGDATGWEMVRALLEKTRRTAAIEVRSFACSTDLVRREGRVVGCRFLGDDGRAETDGARPRHPAGHGRRGPGLRGDHEPAGGHRRRHGHGPARGRGAPATWSSCSSIPRPCAVPGAPRFLVSEAVRGEGAYLRNAAGERFTEELAPRDQVARAIAREVRRDGGPVTLDLRHLDAERVRTRFPRIAATCAALRHRHRHASRCPVTPPPTTSWAGWPRTSTAAPTLPGLYAAGRGGGHRRPRREPAGQQLAARGPRLRGAGRRGDGGRRPPEPPPERGGRPRGAGRRRAPPTVRRAGAAPPGLGVRSGLERDAAGLRDLLGFLEPVRPGWCPPRRTAARPRTATSSTWPGPWPSPPSSARRAGAAHFRTDFPRDRRRPLPRPHAAGRGPAPARSVDAETVPTLVHA